jgi:hypothetical protein
MGKRRQLRKGKEYLSSLNEDQLKALAEIMGVDDPALLSNNTYADNVWRWVRKHGKEAAATEYLNVKVGFNDQLEEIDEREEIWKQFSDKVEELLSNTPEYKIPDAIKKLNENIGTYASNIKDEYVSAGNKLEAITGEKLDNIISGAVEGGKKQLNIAEEGAKKLGEIYGEGAEKLFATGEESAKMYGDYSSKIIDTLEKGGEESLSAKLKGIGEYENVYGRLAARTTLPGEDIMKAQLGSQRESAIQKVKEYGAGSPGGLSAIANVYEGEQEQLRNLEVQKAQYLTENQKNYAKAMLTGGLERGGAISEKASTMAGAYQTGAQLTGKGLGDLASMYTQGTQLKGYGEETGLETVLGANRYATELGYKAGMEGLQTELDVSKQAGLLRAMGYEKEADMLINNSMTQATYEDQAFNINEMLPWQNKLAYYSGGTQQYDPFNTKMQTFGDITGYAQSEREALYNKQIANRQMWGNILGSLIGAGGKAVSTLAMGG